MRGARENWNTGILTITRPPKLKEVYWIGTFSDSKEPEFTGFHPGVVISGCKTLNEPTEFVNFVPLTSIGPRRHPATGAYAPYIHQLSKNPNPEDDKTVWAICNHVMTVRISRLERYLSLPKGLVVPEVSNADFEGILDGITNGIVVLRTRAGRKQDAAVEAACNALKAEHARAISDLEARHKMEIEDRAFEMLDQMTS